MAAIGRILEASLSAARSQTDWLLDGRLGNEGKTFERKDRDKKDKTRKTDVSARKGKNSSRVCKRRNDI